MHTNPVGIPGDRAVASTTARDERFCDQEFLNPAAAWRGKPFWSWNGKLKKDELIRQIHVLKEMGMGGYFMHSRTGLVTPYLGDDWFELTNACVEEGERLGLESWLYDEDRWPSGTAGGMVTANPQFRMKFIHLEMIPGETFDLAAWLAAQERPLGAWSCRLENRFDAFDVQPVTAATAAETLVGRMVLAFRIIPMAPGSFYNGNTYVDTMKREATDAYILLTHEAYKKHCGHYFGKGIKGIFTDEPHRGGFMSGFGATPKTCADLSFLVPWTDVLFDTFAEMHGETIEAHLPELFMRLDGKPVSHRKAQYAETMLTLFLNNFARPYYEWCEQNDLLLTGHVLHENSLSSQVSTNGSVQRYYPLMHVPGIDYLGEHGRDYWVAKQVDSTARQFNQKWILSELYGCTGWQMNFESHKAIGGWQALFGVNLRCHHLSWYTMGGEAKRDYPASILHQSPWYKEYAFVESWFARLGYFRAQGQPCCDLLVLNPVESVWGRVYPGAIRGMDAADDGIKELEHKFRELFHILAGSHIDFDYGDEALLHQHGAVITADGAATLRLGAMSYTTVLVAGMDSMRSSTLAILKACMQAGVRVIVAGEPPAYLDSQPSEQGRELAEKASCCAFEEAAIVDALKGHTPRRVEILEAHTGKTATDVFCQLRAREDELFLTALNMNRDSAIQVEIYLYGVAGGALEEWDLETGRATQQPWQSGPKRCFKTWLQGAQARCFRVCRESLLAAAESEPKTSVGEPGIVLDVPATYHLADQNVCVLDLPAWSVDGGEEQPIQDILQMDRELRNRLGLPLRGGDMVQPWFRGDRDCQSLAKLTMRYPVRIADDLLPVPGILELVMETPESFSIAVNGKIIPMKDRGWWVDIALRRIELPGKLFRAGDNEITVACDFRENLNLEAMYLLGDFAVCMEATTPRLSRKPETLMPTSIVEQGFPFYSGSIHYHYEVPVDLRGKELLVRITAYEGAYCRVRSGAASRLLPWRPNEAVLRTGSELEVEVCITRKNTFGPLHLLNPRPAHTGPGHFTPGHGQHSLEPVFIESGLTAPVCLHPIERKR